MKLPSQVKIGGRTYTIELVNELKEKGVDLLGQCDYNNSIIYISKQHKEGMPNTFLHECIHAILDDRGQAHKEELVEQLTNGLIALFRDNPKLLRVVFHS